MLRLLIDENVDHRILRGLLRRVPQLDFLVVAQIGMAGTKRRGFASLGSARR